MSAFCEHDRSPLEALEASGIPFTIHSTGKRITREELLRDAADASVIVAGVEPYDAGLLASLKELECISRCGVGVDAIDLTAAKERNITVLNTPDVPTQAVAELAVALYFSLSRNLRRQSNSMGEKKWERLETHLVSGKTIGLIGFGRIGRRITELCRPFGINFLVNDPYIDQAMPEGVTMVSKEELLSRSDIVSIHASKKGNELILDGKDIDAMKKGAILVNLSRGGMIDEQALCEALKSKKLFGAGLDVFGSEPYSGPLCELDNVILTPHSATMAMETRVAMEMECVDKAIRFLKGSIAPNEKVI